MNITSIAYAFLAEGGAAAGSSEAAGNNLMSWGLMIGSILLLFWFMSRPYSKEQKRVNQMLSSLKTGDKVVTIGGIKASITNIIRDSKNEILEVQLLIDDKNNVKVMFDPRAIAYVVTPEDEKKE